jgi:hypothetical protein
MQNMTPGGNRLKHFSLDVDQINSLDAAAGAESPVFVRHFRHD